MRTTGSVLVVEIIYSCLRQHSGMRAVFLPLRTQRGQGRSLTTPDNPRYLLQAARGRRGPIGQTLLQTPVSVTCSANSIGVRKARFRASLPSEPDRRVSRIRLASRWFAAERSDERLAGTVWRAPFQRSELTLPSPQSRGVITMNLDLHRTLSV